MKTLRIKPEAVAELLESVQWDIDEIVQKAVDDALVSLWADLSVEIFA
jgi:hypothetical protein